jgi:hypothetical protein
VSVIERDVCGSASSCESADMAVYYFDLREGGAFVVDEEGMELI